jgi:hypothetical protein
MAEGKTKTADLAAAGKVLSRDRKGSFAGLAFVSPLTVDVRAAVRDGRAHRGRGRPVDSRIFPRPARQLRLYVGGASAAAKTGAGGLVTSSFTSPWGIALQLLLLLGLVGTRIDWAGMHQRHEDRRTASIAGPPASGER